MPYLPINVKLADYMLQKQNPNRSGEEKLTTYIVDDICIFVTIWEINPRRPSSYWQLENTVLWELYLAILVENDIKMTTNL